MEAEGDQQGAVMNGGEKQQKHLGQDFHIQPRKTGLYVELGGCVRAYRGKDDLEKHG